MLNFYTVSIQTQNGEMEIYVSPFLLHAKVWPDIKSGPLDKLYFYRDLVDDEYKTGLEKEGMSNKLKDDGYVINFGQDFERYYLGSLNVDFENKRFWQWAGYSDQLTDEAVQALGESLFNSSTKFRRVVLFTPTRPSDFNFGRHRFE
jgi:hypothetical protein